MTDENTSQKLNETVNVKLNSLCLPLKQLILSIELLETHVRLLIYLNFVPM
jgi:hypothetical protein